MQVPGYRRTDGTFVPNFHGVIETDDGATIYVEYHGYGRTYPAGRRQWLVAGTHVSDAEQYKWLNDAIAVGTGEVRRRALLHASAHPDALLVLYCDRIQGGGFRFGAEMSWISAHCLAAGSRILCGALAL